VGELYLKDVLKELEKPGLDPRTTAKAFAFDPNVKTFDDVRIGMILPGIVNNITAFGCFVERKWISTHLSTERWLCL